MKSSDLLYFDNAATTYPKPPSVLKSIRHALEEAGGNPGRSGHRLSATAATEIYACREEVAAFFDMPRSEGVVFTHNATYALNTAIFAFAREGGHILLSDMEHNAVFRPVYHLAEEGKISYEVYPTGKNTAEEVARRIRENTCLVIANHASNVCGRILPVAEIGAVCRGRGVPFLVDASQSAGHLPLSMERMGIDALCAPSHKGLYGIQGAGLLLFRDALQPTPLVYGGSGAFSTDPRMPTLLPERLEAGTLPTPAILALRAGLAEVKKRGVSAIAEKIARLEGQLYEELGNMRGVRLVLPEERGNGVLSFEVEGRSPAALSDALDEVGVALRSGLHCAPLAHRTLGTEVSGTLRLSLGFTNTERDCKRFLERLHQILSKNA